MTIEGTQFDEKKVSSWLITAIEMKCVGLFVLVLSILSIKKLRQYEVSLKTNSLKAADEQIKIKSADLGSKSENAEKFEDIEEIPTDLIESPIHIVTVTLNDFEVNLVSSFSNLENTLGNLIHSTSTTLASTSNKLFSIVHNLTERVESLADALSFLSNSLPGAFSTIEEATTNLNIGTGTPGAVVAIRKSVLELLRIRNEADQSQANVTQAFDDAVLAVGEKVQVLVVAITAIADAAATKIASIKEEVKEIVVALTLILHTVLTIVQSICYSIAAVMLASQKESSTLNSLLLITDGALQIITNVVSSITTAVTAKMSFIVGTIGVTLTSLTSKFNASMDKLLARSLLNVTHTLGSIVYSFVGSAGNVIDSIANSLSTITLSLRIISESDSGLHSKVCRQLFKIFINLLQLTGSDDEIITNLSKQLPNIFETIKLVSNSLITGFGTEAAGAMAKAVEDIINSVNRIMPFLTVESGGYLKINNIEFTTKQIAKYVQVLTTIIAAVASTISEGIDSVTIPVFEALIALQFLHSTILYVVQWVSALSASVCLTKTSTKNQITSSLAIVVAVTLGPVSRALSMIATSLSDGLLYVVKSTLPLIIEVCTTSGTALSKVSDVEANIKVTLEQITGNSGSISVEGFVNETVGTVSQILNGVTGSLGSISSTLSSSLSSLDASLNEIKSTNSDLLKTVGSTLSSITTKISQITGSATGILSPTLSSLSTVFGNLFDVISKLSILGDITTYLGSSVSKISAALYSIIDAANGGKRNVYVINEPVTGVARSVQILISSFAATFKAAEDASDEVFKSVSEAISAVPYIMSCIVVLVQHILGAVIATMSVGFGSITFTLEKLTESMSTILEKVISISTEITSLVTVSDGKVAVLTSNITSSVSKLNIFTESSLSKISGIKANVQATLNANPAPVEPEL